MRNSWIVGTLLLVGTLVSLAVSCGGGGGNGAINVNGWWSWNLVDPTGSDVLDGVVMLQIEDTGDTVRIMDVLVPRTGDAFGGRVPEGQPSYQDWRFWILGADAVDGTIEIFDSDTSTDIESYQLRRTTAPTGTLFASGTLFGEPLGVNGAVAYGTDRDLSGMYVFWVRYDAARDPFSARFRVLLDPTPGIPTGTYDVGSAIGDVNVTFSGFQRGDSDASSGQLVIDSISDTRIVGSFDLDLSDADEAEGNFDVPLQPAP